MRMKLEEDDMLSDLMETILREHPSWHHVTFTKQGSQTLLDTNRSLRENGIKASSIIVCHRKIQLFISFLGKEQKNTVMINSSSTIEQLQELVSNISGFPVDQLKLSIPLRGKELQRMDLTLSDYGICALQTIGARLKMRQE